MKKLILLVLFLNSWCFACDLDLKIGSMIMIGFEGNTINTRGYKKALKQVKNNEITGVILFSKNIKSKDDLILMNEKMLEANSTPPFIALDNEGGYVQRYDFIKHPSAKEVALNKDKEEFAKEEYKKMAQLEHELKLNLNFAPCVDLEINKSSIIAKKQRSYSDDYKKVVKYAKIFIDEHNKQNIITSIKHFPGHGSPVGDTHKGFVDSTDTFIKDEIMPYFELSNYSKLNMVMVSHVYNSNFDPEFPSSLSKKCIKDMLINSIGYKGVIVSDDYDMKAIRDNYTLREIVVNSINAGVDILLFSNNLGYKDKNLPLKIKKIIKEEIKKGNIKEEDIDNSYKKIMALKNAL